MMVEIILIMLRLSFLLLCAAAVMDFVWLPAAFNEHERKTIILNSRILKAAIGVSLVIGWIYMGLEKIGVLQ